MIVGLVICALVVLAVLVFAAALCRSGAIEDAYLSGYAEGWGEGFEHAETMRRSCRVVPDQEQATRIPIEDLR